MNSGYSVAFPVFLAEEVQGEPFQLTGETIGTAFALPQSYVLTAGHVGREIKAAAPRIGVVGLSDPSSPALKGARVVDVEALDGDVAVLKVAFPSVDSARWFHTLKWQQIPLNPFDQVRSMGFPYGTLRVDNKLKLVQRVFQGHVVSRIIEFKPLGAAGRPFAVYELSFAAPRGLSGAPLLNCVGSRTLHGMIIGNSESKMVVFHAEEIVKEAAATTVVEQSEVLRLGIAVTADHILGCRSDLLGGNVRGFLEATGKLA